ncbi:hypothetical protein [uncultured Erythrobacter sp.]|uniref:hypothetical protein n=1 Tax=uncultured Erythrobacter sp. TaxID=263913 RepID=UPI002625AAEB|nr:hypothetical protein [uncultured Erythrobacter sp.]
MSGSGARTIATWQAPLVCGGSSDELLFTFNRARERRVLVLPALFDEANKMRRFTVQMMHALKERGVDSFLPDLPGCNESLEPLELQTLESWRTVVEAAMEAFDITDVLTIRAGTLLSPPSLPTWHFAPLSGPKLLRAMIRARTIAAREAGHEESSEGLIELGRKEGLMLAGWHIGPKMFRELETAEPVQTDFQTVVTQKDLGGRGLWLRAEPDDDYKASKALAAIIAGELEDAG